MTGDNVVPLLCLIAGGAQDYAPVRNGTPGPEPHAIDQEKHFEPVPNGTPGPGPAQNYAPRYPDPPPERMREIFALADQHDREYQRFLAARYDADLAEQAALRAARRRELCQHLTQSGRPRLRLIAGGAP
jgi:hypothetical protein